MARPSHERGNGNAGTQVRLTLRTKTALLTTSLVLALVGATGWWQYSRLSDGYVTLMRGQQQALTDNAAADLDFKLSMYLAVLTRAARQADAQTFADPALQHRFLTDRDLRAMFDGASLVTLDGTMIATEPPIGKRPNVADRDYFRRARDAAEPAISAPLLSKTRNQPAVVMAVPVKDPEGRLIGLLGAALNLQSPNLLGNLSRASVGQGGYYVIVTRGSTPVIVMHPDAALLLTSAAPGASAALHATETDLVTHATVPRADWELRVVMPAHTAYAPLEQAKKALLLQLLGLGSCCALLIWLATAWLMRPLAALGVAIRNQRHSPDTPVKLDVVANDERGDLAREFDALMTELRDQRVAMAAVTDASPLGLFRCDANGRITYANDAYLAIHGLERQDIAEGWLALVREDIRDTVRKEWVRLISTGEPVNAVRRLHRTDGSTVLASMRSRPMFVDGQVTGHVGTVTDITESTRAERALRTLTAIFESTTDFVVQLNMKGQVTYMNPAARRRTGVGLDAPIEHLTLADFNPAQTLERFRSEVAPTSMATGVWVGESMVWDAERREFPVNHMVIAHRDKQGKVEYFSGLMRDISAAKTADQALRHSVERLRMVTDHLPALVSYLDRDLRFRFVNKTYQDWFGIAPAQLLGMSLREFYGDAVWAEIEGHMRSALAGRELSYDRVMENSAGGRRYVQATLVPERDDRGEVMGLYTLISDITPYRTAEQALQESEARLRTVADALPMRVAYIDATEHYRFNNLAYERGFGRSRGEIQGHTVRELLGDAAYGSVEPHIRAVLGGKQVTFQSEMTSGETYVCYEAHYIPQFAVNGKTVLGFHAVITDVTRQKLEERRLVNLARVDPLTGLGNRAGFELRLAEAMARSRNGGTLMALMYLDIDRFKQINDGFGHNVGDALLRGFADRLLQTLRSSDIVCRLGGDEFTVIMESLPRPEMATRIASKIVQAVSEPLTIDQQTIAVTASIGVAFYQGGSASAEALTKQADEMLYAAKGAGRNNVQVAAHSVDGDRAGA